MDQFSCSDLVLDSTKDENLTCELCSETFSSKLGRIIHTSVHFTNKLCSICGQILLRINDEWYGVHNAQSCGQQYPSDPVEDALDLNVFKEEIEHNEILNISIENGNCNAGLDINSEKMVENSPIYLLPDNHPKSENQSDNEYKDRCEMKQKRQRKVVDSKLKKDVFLENEPVPNNECDDEMKKKKRAPATKFMDHRPKTSLTCDICKKVLANFNSLKAHMFNMHIQHKRKRFPCTECDLTLASRSILKAHMRTHGESKAFVCTYCGRGFNQYYNLKEHSNRHTGLKPYSCITCGKKFSRKTNLVSHTRVHTGEKPYKCQEFPPCERSYMFEIDLKRHRFSAHGIYTKKHICPIPTCSKVFPENKFLKRHLESHAEYKLTQNTN